MLLFSTQLDNSEDIVFMLDVHERYNRLVHSKACQYLTDTNEIEDLMQDCWLKLCQHIATLKTLDEKALAAYIAVTVRNTAYNYMTYQSVRNRYTAPADVDVDEHIDSTPSPEEQVLLTEQLDQFHEVLSRLSVNDRRLLEGKYILHWSDEELAGVFQCKPASIRMKLSRARQRAMALLQEGESIDGQT